MTRSDLDHLRLFASFGKMIIDQNPNASCVPFQQEKFRNVILNTFDFIMKEYSCKISLKLIFAIRDWDLDDDLGLEAGNKLLSEVMEDCKQSEEGADLALSIKTSFQKISCSILRHPGNSLRDEDFDGSF